MIDESLGCVLNDAFEADVLISAEEADGCEFQESQPLQLLHLFLLLHEHCVLILQKLACDELYPRLDGLHGDQVFV